MKLILILICLMCGCKEQPNKTASEPWRVSQESEIEAWKAKNEWLFHAKPDTIRIVLMSSGDYTTSQPTYRVMNGNITIGYLTQDQWMKVHSQVDSEYTQ
jgi:ABC-type uncharacterized transport system auxiliary subunit